LRERDESGGRVFPQKRKKRERDKKKESAAATLEVAGLRRKED